MAWTISVVLLSLWLFSIAIPSTLHGYIYLLPALAVVIVIVSILIKKRRVAD